MTTITIEEAQARLSELIAGLAPGEGLVITRDARPIARLVGLPAEKPHPVLGRGRGELVIVSEDDDHLDFTNEVHSEEAIRQGLEEMRAGLGRPADEVLADIRRDLDLPHDA